MGTNGEGSRHGWKWRKIPIGSGSNGFQHDLTETMSIVNLVRWWFLSSLFALPCKLIESAVRILPQEQSDLAFSP